MWCIIGDYTEAWQSRCNKICSSAICRPNDGSFSASVCLRSETLHEEAMLAIGALAYATGPEFSKYMSEFCTYLEMGLQNFEEYQVCAVTVGVVGDICHALEAKNFPLVL